MRNQRMIQRAVVTLGLAVFMSLTDYAQELEPAAPAGPAGEAAAPEPAVEAPAEPAPVEPLGDAVGVAEAPAPPALPVEPLSDAVDAASEAPAPETTPAGTPEPLVEFLRRNDRATGTGLTQSDDELISITLDNVPLEDVVRMFMRISGANIIASQAAMEGTVTVNLTNVAWQPALSTILDMHSLSLVEKRPGSGVYSIVPKMPDAPEPTIVQTLFLLYTTVDDVEPVVKSMLAAGGFVTKFTSRNALVVRTHATNMGEIEQLLKKLDIRSKQVCVETKFVSLDDEATEQLGVRWDSLAEFGATLKGGPFEWNREVTRDKTRVNTLKQWDERQNQDTRTERYDVYGQPYQDGDPIPATPTREVIDTIDTGENVQRDVVDTFTKSIIEKQAAILELDSFQVVLSALKQTQGASLISNPKIIVASGEKTAKFSVGEREPIIKTEVTRGTAESPGDKVTAQLDTSINTDYIRQGYLSTGIDLEVEPTVKTDDLIEVDIRPTLKRKVADKEVAGNSWPVISVKEIKTKFTLRSGQTVAIGGLTDALNDKQISKIPLLGDIPLIGKYLFSHRKDVKSQNETIIFVTLSLANPDTLHRAEGIPDSAELIHKDMIKSEVHRREFLDELDGLQEAAGVDLSEPAPAGVVAPTNAPEAEIAPVTEPAPAAE